MKEIQEKNNTPLLADIANVKPDNGADFALYKERLKILLYDIQLVLFRYLQKELFADDHDKFQSWLLGQSDLMKKISEVGRQIIGQSLAGESFDKARVADQILSALLEDEKIMAELKKYQPDLDQSSFNYYAIDEILNKERPNRV